MDYDKSHCVDCDSWFDEAYFDAKPEKARNLIGYDGTTYINIKEIKNG